MQRDVSARIGIASRGRTRLAFAIGVAAGYDVSERFEASQGGRPLEVAVAADLHGTRIHLVEVDEGPARFSYSATVRGTAAPLPLDPLDDWRYLRPSRYAESDMLRPMALAEFAGLGGSELLNAVSAWVGTHLTYRSGSSLPTDSAVRTLLNREGVCRDFAHLTVGLLRALDIPARIVGVYAPGLEPMDFHAVAEAHVAGDWHVIDATGLAPRSSLVRIATGRDAADIAFLTSHGADLTLTELEVAATVDRLPVDEPDELVVIR